MQSYFIMKYKLNCNSTKFLKIQTWLKHKWSSSFNSIITEKKCFSYLAVVIKIGGTGGGNQR